MPDLLFSAGSVLIPLAFGLVPGVLPRRVPLTIRWWLWLALLGISAWYVVSVRATAESLSWLALGLFWLSSMLSLVVLVAETRRRGV